MMSFCHHLFCPAGFSGAAWPTVAKLYRARSGRCTGVQVGIISTSLERPLREETTSLLGPVGGFSKTAASAATKLAAHLGGPLSMFRVHFDFTSLIRPPRSVGTSFERFYKFGPIFTKLARNVL